MKPIELAARKAGSPARLAELLGVTAPAVKQWEHGIRPVPESRCVQIEQVTSGAVTAEQLRPDVNWIRIPDPSWPHPKGRPLVDLAPELTHDTSEQVPA